MIFETHAHYEDEKFDPDRVELLSSMEKNRIGRIINVGSSMSTSIKSVELAYQYDFIYAAVGIHPVYADTWDNSSAERLSGLLSGEKVVAIGEIGLDYYRGYENREKQKFAFTSQLELAAREKMPVIIHNRKAHGDIYDILRHYRPDGVMHCFSGSVESAREALNMGLYIGLGGSVTFANAVKPVEVAKYVPLDRLVLETDAPYIIPRRFRTGEKKYGRSESWMIDYVAEFIAEIRGIEKEKLLDITANNAARLYGVKIL